MIIIKKISTTQNQSEILITEYTLLRILDEYVVA